MCGLSGVLLYPQERSAERWHTIVRTFTDCLVFNESRGREASGVSVVGLGGGVRLLKSGVPASDLVPTEAYRELFAGPSKDVVCLLGHTRRPTKGSPRRNDNNHPIQAGHVVGVHNGVIDNDDDLFELHGFPRLGEVDSEVIFRLLECPENLPGCSSDPQWLEARTAELEGTFATLSIDTRRPAVLVALRKGRPLCLHYDAEAGALFFSSRYIFLRKTFGRAVVTEVMLDGYGYIFDANRLPDLGSRPCATFHLASDGPAGDNTGQGRGTVWSRTIASPSGKERFS